MTLKDYPRTKNGKVLRKQLVKQLHEEYHAKETGEEIVEYKARRSMLFVPSYNEKYARKAKTVLADSVIFDLEAILEDQREPGRNIVKKVFSEFNGNFGESERVLRVNKLGTEDFKKIWN